MQRFHDVTLQLVRPGPPHNQLLSPLTSYLALCGDSSPVTFHIGFEHRKLLNQLEHLRYEVNVGRPSGGAVPERLRQAAAKDLGEQVGSVFSEITSLNVELAKAAGAETGGDNDQFVHLRLVLSSSELSLLPLELAISPQSFPGEGLSFCLQGKTPIVMTREIQRSRPMPVDWNRKAPKILFVFAEPGGLSVPKLEHAAAIQSAVRQWVDIADDGSRHSSETKKHLRVLANASIEDIDAICGQEDFTHVHILAHGAAFEDAGEQHFGVALCRKGAPGKPQVVDGKRLAKALKAEGDDGISRANPLMVTLATCDSGHPGSVLDPGGSIAHDLHAEGIPWVFASQFPLTIPGSIRMAEHLYPRILRGHDPRQVLYELRRKLYLSAANDHDWASIVAYTSMQERFVERVAEFYVEQTKRAINVQLSWADKLVNSDSAGDEAKEPIEEALQRAKKLIAGWEERLPGESEPATRGQRAECFGMKGSVYKRIGILQGRRDEAVEAEAEFEKAAAAYQQAMDEWAADGNNFHWTATQSLSLAAVLGKSPDSVIHQMATRLAERDCSKTGRVDRAWAHGTLAELALLAPWHEGKMADGALPSARELRPVKKDVLSHCREIVALVGPTFPVESTRRQFQRYVDRWHLGKAAGAFLSPEIVAIAKAAAAVLTIKG